MAMTVHDAKVTQIDAIHDAPPDCVRHLRVSTAKIDATNASKIAYAYEKQKYCPKFCIALHAKNLTPLSGVMEQDASGMTTTFQIARRRT
jgi:hypothetical protein